MNCYRIKIVGDFRGTAFRSAAMHAAQLFRIKGFIQYNKDNSLGMDILGDPDDIDQFVRYCRIWLSSVSITDFTVTEKEPETYTGFTIRRTVSKEEKLKQNQYWLNAFQCKAK